MRKKDKKELKESERERTRGEGSSKADIAKT